MEEKIESEGKDMNEKIESEGKNMFLVTTREWFYGPDGELYRAILGGKRNQDNEFLNLGSKKNNISIPWKSVVSCILLKEGVYPIKKDIFVI